MTITADQDGRIYGKFTIPADIPAGTKLVEFDGSATEASASFAGKGVLTIEDLRVVNTITRTRTLRTVYEPVAQTFIVPMLGVEANSVRQVVGARVVFTAVGPSNVVVHIRETELGFPTQTVVAEAIVRPDDVTVDVWHEVQFRPWVAEPGREYAMVLLCDDAIWEVSTAGIGEFDAAAQEYVSIQPYRIGTLLSSSNGSTWTAHQTKDLTFQLLTADWSYNSTYGPGDVITKEVALPPVDVVDADHLVVGAAVERPTADCDCVFELTIDGVVYSVMEMQPFTLATRFTGTIVWKAILTGTIDASPVLFRQINLIAGERLFESNYVTRLMQNATGRDVTMYFDALLPAGSSIAANIEDDDDDWSAFLPDAVEPTTDLGDGWIEHKYTHTLTSNRDQSRVELVLSGSGQALPIVSNLRIAITS